VELLGVAVAAVGQDRAHRAGQRAADPVLRRRARARPAQELLEESPGRLADAPLERRAAAYRDENAQDLPRDSAHHDIAALRRRTEGQRCVQS
jgi:hypothetical protein